MPEKTTELKDLLVEQLQDLLSAEKQLVAALPKMEEAARNAKLKEVFGKHLEQTKGHVERLSTAIELLGGQAQAKTCKGMKGLIEEGEEVIQESKSKDELGADLSLIGAAQRVEHYEISGYGTAKCLARGLGEIEVARLLSQTLGDEEAADFLLTTVAEPLMQQALSVEIGNGTKAPWGEPGETTGTFIANPGNTKTRAAAASTLSVSTSKSRVSAAKRS